MLSICRGSCKQRSNCHLFIVIVLYCMDTHELGFKQEEAQNCAYKTPPSVANRSKLDPDTEIHVFALTGLGKQWRPKSDCCFWNVYSVCYSLCIFWMHKCMVVVLVFYGSSALQHFSGHFGHGQLTYQHCSWASLLDSLPVLSAHSFVSK